MIFVKATSRIAVLMSALWIGVGATSTRAVGPTTLPTTAPSPAELSDLRVRVASLIKGLEDDQYQVRDAAATDVWQLPVSAIPVLRETLKDRKLEASARLPLERCLQRLKVRAEAEPRVAARRAWFSTVTVNAYEKVGRHDARWDGAVNDSMKLLPAYWADGATDRSVEPRLYADLRSALDAGCDDALVRYAYARLYEAHVDDQVATINRNYKDAAGQIYASQYPPLLKMISLLRASRVDQAMEQLPAVAADKSVPTKLLCDVSAGMVERADPSDRTALLERVLHALTDANVAEAVPLIVRARYDLAVRTAGRAMDIPGPDDSNQMPTIDDVRQLLARAWQADPTDPTAALTMLYAFTTQSGRAEPIAAEQIDLWFGRANEADPTAYEAYYRKLQCMAPSGGNETAMGVASPPVDDKAMLAFGHQCLATQNFSSRLPFILVEAHVMLATRFHSAAVMNEPDREYFKEPGVFADLESVYEPYLRLHPESTHDRTLYAKYACWAEKWDVADREFTLLGDTVEPALLNMTGTHSANPTELLTLRKIARAHALQP